MARSFNENSFISAALGGINLYSRGQSRSKSPFSHHKLNITRRCAIHQLNLHPSVFLSVIIFQTENKKKTPLDEYLYLDAQMKEFDFLKFN